MKLKIETEDIINKHMKPLAHEPFASSVKYFLESGKVTGSFWSAIMKIIQESIELNRPSEQSSNANHSWKQ